MLRSHPELSDRKRFRGKRRYFERLDRRSRAYDLYIEPNMWWYYHHEHLDYMGRGNLRWKYRRPSLLAHIALLKRIGSELSDFTGEFQAWLSVAVPNAINDAVYLHSPNPHSEFPADFSNTVREASTIPDELLSLDDSGLIWGQDEDRGFSAFMPGVGLDLRS